MPVKVSPPFLAERVMADWSIFRLPFQLAVPRSSQVGQPHAVRLQNADSCSTPLLQDWLGDDREKRLRREVHFPSGRFGEAIEQAQAVVFLASDESSFVNATDFVVDGGLTKAYVTPEGPPTEAPRNQGS